MCILLSDMKFISSGEQMVKINKMIFAVIIFTLIKMHNPSDSLHAGNNIFQYHIKYKY